MHPLRVHFSFKGVYELRDHLPKLIALQTVDIKLQEMERLKHEIPQRIALLEETIRKEEEKVRAERAELDQLIKERRKKEKELDEEIEKVKKSEARLFEIKTNKEYQAVLKEIDTNRKLNRQREEEILEILERFESLQRNLLRDEKELETRRTDWGRQIQVLKEQAITFDHEMAQERQRRDEKEREIPSALLGKYNLLLGKRHGVAVARVIGGVCQACYMNLRPQLFIELQKQETLVLCPNCSRILFFENGVEEPPIP